jgi:hypothetical protein
MNGNFFMICDNCNTTMDRVGATKKPNKHLTYQMDFVSVRWRCPRCGYKVTEKCK